MEPSIGEATLDIDILGVLIPVRERRADDPSGGRVQKRQKSTIKARRQMERISIACPSPFRGRVRRQRLVRQLILSKITWGVDG